MKNKALIIIAVIIYIASAGLSYALFSNVPALGGDGPADIAASKGEINNDYEALTFNGGPKTEECPLNGAKYSEAQRKWWETHRPLGIMVENHVDSRPQSGLGFADVVYEAVAEGGITRFLAVYHCQDAGIVGPVRSARTYFLDYISEYGEYPLYAHVGGANTPGPANALGQIDEYGWGAYNDLNQFAIGFPTFRRDESRLGRSVATEHTMYSVTSKLWEVGSDRGLTNEDEDGNSWDEEFTPYSFKEDKPGASAQTVGVSFWDSAGYAVEWKYDPESNSYLRSNGGSVHKDRNTNKQISAKNVVVLFMTEGRANDGYEGNLHMLYGTKGTGKASVFMDGKRINGTWKKSGRTGRTVLVDSTDSEIEFNRGKIWFMIQPLDGLVTLK